LVYIEAEYPAPKFEALGFLSKSDFERARNGLFFFVKNRIESIITKHKNVLTDEQKEALEYFNLK
jgi:hypothetical protein